MNTPTKEKKEGYTLSPVINLMCLEQQLEAHKEEFPETLYYGNPKAIDWQRGIIAELEQAISELQTQIA